MRISASAASTASWLVPTTCATSVRIRGGRPLQLLPGYAPAKGEDPACVSACRFDALVFGDINDPNAFVTKLLDFKDSVRVRPQLGTKPSLRYIPLKKES